MLRLILLRHATAEPARAGQADHDRPLARAGHLEAAAAGERLHRLGEKPDLVLCSTGLRTRQTLDGVLPALDGSPEVRYLDSLFSGPDYLDVIPAEAGDAGTILVIGHNPFIQDAAVRLAAPPAVPGTDPSRQFPAGTFAVLVGGTDWSRLAPGTMQIRAFVTPAPV